MDGNNQWLNDLEQKKDIDGCVPVNYEMLKTLVNEREKYKKDIVFTVAHIRRLLIQLGILTADGEFRFKMSSIVKSVSKLMFNPEAMQKDFEYLGELGDIVQDYQNVK